MGWLSAKPKDFAEQRYETVGIELPEIPPTERLAEVWNELGRTGAEGAFTWVEIKAYGDLTGVDLSSVECRTLRAMSVAYAEGLQDDNPFSIAPIERADALV